MLTCQYRKFLAASPALSLTTSSMASRKSRPPSSSRSQSPRIPAPPGVGSQRGRRHTGGGHDNDDYSPPRKRRPRSRFDEPGYTQPREKNIGNKVDLLFCVFQSASSSSWRTAPYHFDRRRIDDRDLWEDIRGLVNHPPILRKRCPTCQR